MADSSLTERYAAVKKDNEHLKASNDRIRGELKDTNEDLRDAREALKKATKAHETELDAATSRAKDLENQLSTARNDLSSLQSSKSTAEMQIGVLKETHANELKRRDEDFRKLKEEHSVLEHSHKMVENELAVKTQELLTAIDHFASERRNYEETLADLMHKYHKAEESAQQLSAKFAVVLKESKQHYSQLQFCKEELRTTQSQLENSTAVNKELLCDLEAIQVRAEQVDSKLHGKASEVEEGMNVIDTLRKENDDLVVRLDKAEKHLSQVMDESSVLNVDVVKLRHRSANLEDELQAMKREHDDFVSKLVRHAEQTAEETDLLASEVDTLFHITHPREDGYGGASRTIVSSKPSAALVDADESACIVALARIRDALSMAVHDLTCVKDQHMREKNKQKDILLQSGVVEDAYMSERDQASLLRVEVDELRQQLKEANEEKEKYQRSLNESAEWMAEAVGLSEVRTQRIESLVGEIEHLEHELKNTRRELEEERNRSKEQHSEAEKSLTMCEDTRNQLRAYERAKVATEDELHRVKRTSNRLKEEYDRLLKDFSDQGDVIEKHRVDREKLEVDKARLEKQVNDVRAQCEEKDLHLAALGKRERELKDENFALQRKIDAMWLKNSAANTQSSGGAAAKSHSSPANDTTARSRLDDMERRIGSLLSSNRS